MNSPFRSLFRSIGHWGLSTVQSLGGSEIRDRMVGRLDRMLILAGAPGDKTSADVVAQQVVALIVLPITAAGILAASGWFDFLFEGPKQMLVYVGLMALGIGFPLFRLREQAFERQRQVALQLPDTLDLLTISVEAGLDFLSALRRVVEKHRPGHLRNELERFFQQIEFGRPRREALRELAARVQVSDMNAVVAALIQADRLGASIGPVLRAQSDMLRTRRSQRAEKAAQEAPVKMLAPLMACILPSVFIVILGPVIIQMIRDATNS